MSEDSPDLLEGAVSPALNPNLFGHGEAEAFLAEAYAGGKMHHALLMEGPRGIGKATLAFRFANHLLRHPDPARAPLMLTPPDPDHPVTRQIASGASHDLLHLTRPLDEKAGRLKSAITVDEIRRAGKFLGQTSGTGNWRVVIVDAADDMNRNAANAVLKILEEPPRRVLFMLVSHAPGKLLPTIRSRCMPLPLRPLAEADLAAALAALEVTLPAASADRILAAAGGSVAEALKLIHYGGLDIMAALETILKPGPSTRREMHKLADLLSAKDAETVFLFFTELAGRRIVAEARASALAGDLGRADRLASLSQSLTEKIAISIGYNLDRKQTVLQILDDMRGAMTG